MGEEEKKRKKCEEWFSTHTTQYTRHVLRREEKKAVLGPPPGWRHAVYRPKLSHEELARTWAAPKVHRMASEPQVEALGGLLFFWLAVLSSLSQVERVLVSMHISSCKLS